ncbi:Peroxisome biosynthesis protein pex1, partial [Kickxella alabastrina]
DGLLRQARVVAVGQPLVFWLNASTHVRLVPRGMVPQAAVALLDNDSEVAVAPMVRRQQQPTPSEEEGRNTAAVSCLRVAGSSADDALPGVVFVHPSSAVAQLSSARIGHGCMPAGASAADDAVWLAPWLAAVAIDARVQPGVLLAQTATLAHMGFAVGEVVRVGAVAKPTVDPPLALHFECFGEAVPGCEDVREALLPGGAGSQAVFGVGFCVAAGARLRSFCAVGEAVGPSECRETPLRVTRETLAQVVITVGGRPKDQKDRMNQPGQPGQPDQLDQLDQSELPGLGDFLALAWQSVEGALLGHGGGLLISGRRGSGKSSAAAALAHTAAHGQRGRLVHSRRIDCAALALDPRTSNARDALRHAIATARANAPSLLILDDLDALLPAAAAEQNGSAPNARRVHVLADTMELLLAGAGRVAVVATATGGRAQVHARLFACGVLRDALELPAPDRAARERILDKIARRSATPPATTFGAAAYASEGFLPGDLAAVYARAAHEATMRALADGSGDDVRVTAFDLQRALAGFRPRAMRGVQTQASATRWADIGGLADTRRQLRETLELPTRYAAVFASSPLRLRSGILLYGFPGCGKTMLASAVARECGLNFIGVKGPELLSKYIGSSEQAVRDLFARAAAAAPCVLFFDEFDAIAPRRGHDNTGVTDRVVNQFLTEMDGAEGLRGVYVLAATSRPDLIDPALLRPGRLDKAFLCAMPGAQDRAAILERHAAKITVAAAVDWVALAGRTERFTGADLQAL